MPKAPRFYRTDDTLSPAQLASSSVPFSSASSSSSSQQQQLQPQELSSKPNRARGEQRRSSRACLECRLAKTKCLVPADKQVCERCHRFKFDCRFVRHHRGRKPVSKIAALGASATASLQDELMSEDSSDEEKSKSDDAQDTSMATKSEPLIEQDHQHPNDPPHHHKHHQEQQLEQSQPSQQPQPQKQPQQPQELRESSPPPPPPPHSKKHSHHAASFSSSSTSKPPANIAPKRPLGESLIELDNASRRRIWDMLASKIPQRGSTYMFVNKGEVAHDTLDSNASSSSSSSSSRKPEHSSSIQSQPSTFRNLLRPVDIPGVSSIHQDANNAQALYPRLPETISFVGPRDPCEIGLLSVTAARKLFDYYFANLNPWAMIFDAALVSHDAIRSSSSVLYTVLLYLASRYIDLDPESDGHDDLFPQPQDRITRTVSAHLASHARGLSVQAFAIGDRTMETGAAMYLCSVWKEADDYITMLYCSYAAKIMSDIPSELLSASPTFSMTSELSNSSTSVLKHRMRRHQQRMFLFHFIQEYAHLLHFAPRPNFDRGPALLRNLLAWSDEELSTEDDIMLCADIDSVLLQAKYKSKMERSQQQERDTIYGGSECHLLLQSFLDEVEEWQSKWEWQAKKIAEKFGRGNDGPRSNHISNSFKLPTFDASLSLSNRIDLLRIFRNSLVMQISSIAFRASLRDINKVQPRSQSDQQQGHSDKNPANNPSAATIKTSSLLSAMDERAEETYFTCLDAALNLLYHTIQMPCNVLRHAQDLIMVLAPHAALMATYLVSLPLPSLPSTSSLDHSSNSHFELSKAKTRIKRRKEYERKCLELLRATRDQFKRAVIRPEDHVLLCWQYFDSLLVVIEGTLSEQSSSHTCSGKSSTYHGEAARGRSTNVAAAAASGSKVARDRRRSTSTLGFDATAQRNEVSESRPTLPDTKAGSGRVSSTGPKTNLDDVAAETLLNLHSEVQAGDVAPLTQGIHNSIGMAATPMSNGGSGSAELFGGAIMFSSSHFVHPAAYSHGYTNAINAGFSPGSQNGAMTTGMMASFSSSPGLSQGTPPMQDGNQIPTPVDWTWLQSFLEVPEFSWM